MVSYLRLEYYAVIHLVVIKRLPIPDTREGQVVENFDYSTEYGLSQSGMKR